MGVCNCSMFCCTLLYVHSRIAIILMGKRELIALLNLSSWCLMMVGRLFLAVPWGCLQFVIVVFPDHTHLLFMIPTLGCDTLQKRRDLARLSMMYRIVHHLVDIPVEPYLTPSTSMTKGHDSGFFHTTYQQSFFTRTVILWNQLPQTAVSQTTLEAFHNQLATHTI